MKFNNRYITAWGDFEIPHDVFVDTEWNQKRFMGMEVPAEPKAIPENWKFFKWLDEQEIKAGKPQKETA